MTDDATGPNLRGQILPGLPLDAMRVPRALRWPARVRRAQRSEFSKAAAITVIPVTAIGAEKLSSWATNWIRAAPTAQTIAAAAAQAMARRTAPDAFARKIARPVSHVAFVFPLMTMAVISPPRLLA